MDRQSSQNVARPMVRWIAAALCGCTVGALDGCGRSNNHPAISAATGSDAASIQLTSKSTPIVTAETERSESPVRLLQKSSQPLPLNDAMSFDGSMPSQIERVAYPPMPSSNANDSPSIRLAQVQPLPLPTDMPGLEPQQQSSAPQSSAPLRQNPSPIAPLPRVAAPRIIQPTTACPISSNFSQAAVAPAIVRPILRSAELDAVVRQADAQTAHGFELAQRGAIYSARAEFIAALQTIAAALDTASANNSHNRMLVAGLQALNEMDDFASRDAGVQGNVDVSRIVAGHQTTVLKDAPLSGLSCSAAMSQYLTFAQEQLSGCSAGIPAGSAALYGLGKIYCVPVSLHGPADETHGAKAVALQQAALIVDNRNYRAANELGVLLAKFGRLPEARAVLLHSIATSSQPTTWRNLAAVHRSLGERDLAERAQQESILAAARLNGAVTGPSVYAVQWLDPATFAATAPLNIDGTPAAARSAQQGSMAAGTSTATKR